MPLRHILFAGFALCSEALLAAAQPPPLEAYGRLPAIEKVTLSPSGERYAFAATVQDRRRLYVRTVDGKPLAMPAIDEVKLRALHWAGERFVIAATSDTYNFGPHYRGSRYELSSYQLIDLDKGRVGPLLDGRQLFNAAAGYYGVRQRDKDWYAYLSAQPITSSDLSVATLAHEPADLYEIDLQSGKPRRLAKGCEGCGNWLIGADGTLVASAQYEDRGGRWRLHAGTRHARELMQVADPFGQNAILGNGRGKNTVLVQQVDAEGRVRYLEVPLSGAAPVEVFAGERVYDFIWDHSGERLRGFIRDDDSAEPVLFDERSAARLRGTLKAFPDLSVRFESWSDDLSRLIVYTQGVPAKDPARADAGTYWLVDIASGQAQPLGAAYPRVRPEQVGPWRMIDYRAADGLALRGVLTLPPGAVVPRKLPLVVLPHGGPEARDYPEFNWWAQAFASRGYAVWQPNFRGSAGYGAALLRAGYGEWGGKMQTDISDGVAELARQGIVDAQRACIVGASYGGYAALAGVTLQQGLYRCAVSVNGVTDPGPLVQRTQDHNGDDALRYMLRFLGAGSAQDERISQRSPVHLASRADAPVLLIHGREDTVVPYVQSVAMQRALKAAGKPVELITLAGEDHWLSREQTRTQMLKAAVAFVQQHNPAGPLR